jgi:hypothetical protein
MVLQVLPEGAASLPRRPSNRRISNDDFVLTVNGVDHAPHQGEWIEVRPITSMADLAQITSIQIAWNEIQAIGSDPAQTVRSAELAQQVLDSLVSRFVRIITQWNWTDVMSGEALAQPAENEGAAVRGLSVDELQYLFILTAPEGTADRKNGSQPSPTASLATATPKTSRSSRKGRSRTKS